MRSSTQFHNPAVKQRSQFTYQFDCLFIRGDHHLPTELFDLFFYIHRSTTLKYHRFLRNCKESASQTARLVEFEKPRRRGTYFATLPDGEPSRFH